MFQPRRPLSTAHDQFARYRQSSNEPLLHHTYYTCCHTHTQSHGFKADSTCIYYPPHRYRSPATDAQSLPVPAMVYAHVMTFEGNMQQNVSKHKNSLNLERITCLTLTTSHLHTSSQLLEALIKNAYN